VLLAWFVRSARALMRSTAVRRLERATGLVGLVAALAVEHR
jgi:hypothetical protein